MQPILTENREKIIELCRAHHVRRLSAFGSAVREDFDPARSDVDLLIEFELPPEVRYARNYFAFQASMCALLLREVDVVVAGAIKNPYMLGSIEAEKELLYAA